MGVLESAVNGDQQGPELVAAESGSIGCLSLGLRMVCPYGALESPGMLLLEKLCSVYELMYHGK